MGPVKIMQGLVYSALKIMPYTPGFPGIKQAPCQYMCFINFIQASIPESRKGEEESEPAPAMPLQYKRSVAGPADHDNHANPAGQNNKMAREKARQRKRHNPQKNQRMLFGSGLFRVSKEKAPKKKTKSRRNGVFVACVNYPG